MKNWVASCGVPKSFWANWCSLKNGETSGHQKVRSLLKLLPKSCLDFFSSSSEETRSTFFHNFGKGKNCRKMNWPQFIWPQIDDDDDEAFSFFYCGFARVPNSPVNSPQTMDSSSKLASEQGEPQKYLGRLTVEGKYVPENVLPIGPIN